MYEIVVGRNAEDRKRYALNGTFLLGRHYVSMGRTTSLSNDVLMDANRSHVVFVVGKRGSGKSWSLGAMAEALNLMPATIRSNIAVILLDTMGIYWTMRYENKNDSEILREWKLASTGINLRIYTPTGYYDAYRDKGIPTDASFSIKPSELSVADWCNTFGISTLDPVGVLIGRALASAQKQNASFSLQDITRAIIADDRADMHTQAAAESLFLAAERWGLFSDKGTAIKDLAVGGQVTVLDVSCYAANHSSTSIRALVIGLLSQKLFDERMIVRKAEEFEAVRAATDAFRSEPIETGQAMPVVWLMIDEAHEFLPLQGATPATKALLTILREGRQPGISLVLASQQPGQIHTDVITQADIVLAHRLTARLDIDALGNLMQSYMRQSLDKELNALPDVKGAALLFDDTNEKIYPIRVRPRLTWHGGSSPSVLKQETALFSD